jgi:uncharacterized Zn-binding protein involved in type VI secretion
MLLAESAVATLPFLIGGRMALPWIVIGDTTTHGGKVLEGEPTFTVDDVPVAQVGHLVTCPKCKGGPFPITTGAPNFSVHGRALARHGDETACGARLISGQKRATWSTEGLAEVAAATQPRQFDEQGQIDAGVPHMAGLPYFIQLRDGRSFSGLIDESGRLPRVDTASEDDYSVLWGDAALVRMQA